MSTAWDKHVCVYSRPFMPDDLASTKRQKLATPNDLYGCLWAEVVQNNFEMVRWLLKIGIFPIKENLQVGNMVDNALHAERFALAALLRKHGASLSAHSAERVQLLLLGQMHRGGDPGHTATALRQTWKFIMDPTTGECAEQAAYLHGQCFAGNRDARVHKSWPPRGVTQWPPAEATQPERMRLAVLDFWSRASVLRRVEARRLVSHNWRIAREFVLIRIVAFYWQGETQKSLCAPAGPARSADLAEFRDEFAAETV